MADENIDDKTIAEDEICVMVSSPVNGFAMAVNHYIKLGYEPQGVPITEEHLGVVTMHQSLINKAKLDKHLDWLREKEDIIKQIKVLKHSCEQISEEVLNIKIMLYTIPFGRVFYPSGNSKKHTDPKQTLEDIKKEREEKIKARLEKINRLISEYWLATKGYTFGDFIEWLFGKSDKKDKK